MLGGLDEIVTCIYFRALPSISTGAPVLQSPSCLFFGFHFPLQEISETIRRIKEETSIQCFQSSGPNDIVFYCPTGQGNSSVGDDVCMNLTGDKMMLIRSWKAIKNGRDYRCPSGWNCLVSGIFQII